MIGSAQWVVSIGRFNGEHNPSDVLSKHWGYQVVWPLLRPLLFWKGDTMDIIREKKKKTVES